MESLEKQEIEVRLNVYDLTKFNKILDCFGIGAYHTVNSFPLFPNFFRVFKYGTQNLHLLPTKKIQQAS